MALLAERLRPSATHPERLVGAALRIWNRELRTWLAENRFHVVLWGPPGSGKTTLARMLGEASGLGFTSLSAVRDGVKDIRAAVEKAPGQLLFIDEIHRYPHDFPGAFVRFEYLPAAVAPLRRREGPAYLPTDFGIEKRLRERLSELWSQRPEPS